MNTFKNKEMLKLVVSKLPLQIYKKLSKTRLTIPYYHLVSDEEVPHTKYLYPHKNVKQFTTDIEFLLKHFVPISLQTLLLHIKQSVPLPEDALLLTFDDGFRQLFDIVAPILKKKGLPAVFFINSHFTDNKNLCYQHKASLIVEYLNSNSVSDLVYRDLERLLPLKNETEKKDVPSRILAIRYYQKDTVDLIADTLGINFNDYLKQYEPYLTTSMINQLISDGFAIGAHSIDHPLFMELPLDEQLRQAIESISFVQNRFGLDYSAFAFPHSDRGVTKAFFHNERGHSLADVTFGTAGMTEDSEPNNYQRFSLENPLLPAENILALQFAKSLWRTLNRKNHIVRK